MGRNTELSNDDVTTKQWYGTNVVYGAEGDHDTPYMRRIWIGRLRLHIFFRGDADPDPHDHPWDFWTFPLHSYVEDVTTCDPQGRYSTRREVVARWRLHYRPATHTHRVLGRYKPSERRVPRRDVGPGRIVTIVWRGGSERKWGFLKYRDGKWCWQHWKEYVYQGGKHAPCE